MGAEYEIAHGVRARSATCSQNNSENVTVVELMCPDIIQTSTMKRDHKETGCDSFATFWDVQVMRLVFVMEARATIENVIKVLWCQKNDRGSPKKVHKTHRTAKNSFQRSSTVVLGMYIWVFVVPVNFNSRHFYSNPSWCCNAIYAACKWQFINILICLQKLRRVLNSRSFSACSSFVRTTV